MKKQFLLFIATAFLGISSLMAQESRQRLTPEEKTKDAMSKMAAFDLKGKVREEVQGIFMDFYTAQQTAMQDARAAGADRNAIMEKRKALTDVRDKKLKEVLTDEQYKKWVTDIEPTMKPQRAATPAATEPAKN